MHFQLLKNQSIGRKIGLLVLVLCGLSLVTISMGHYIAQQTQAIGLQAVEDTMLNNHQSKLKSLVEAENDRCERPLAD